MSKEYLISVTSKDQAGIVANISRVIEKLNGNLSDLNQNVLNGYFSMILFASFPETCSGEKIKEELAESYKKFTANDFSLLVWPMKAKKQAILQAAEPEEKYVLTASAKDRRGLVAEVSAFCARHNLNILSLDTEIRDGLYNMIFLLDAGKADSIDDIRKGIARLENESGLRLMFQHYKIFKATNEIKI